MSRHEVLPEPVPFGKYQLLERLASGRMGEVFKAKRGGVEGFEKVMVVKRIYQHLSSSEVFVSSFINEAKLTVSLSHANIVQVLDLGQHEGLYFVAMEYVAGFDLGTVRRVLSTAGRSFPLDIAVFVVSEVAKGLDYAHRRKDYNFESLNIVHRDLSPANVLVSHEGEVKLTDFGVTKALEAVGTLNDNLRRRYLYASPEQARGEAVTHRSDIFSLGLILYELATGVHPYDDPDPRMVQRRAMEGNIRPIRQYVELPRALEQIIQDCLVPDPNQRVESAGTLYEELISYLFASGHRADNRTLSNFMQEVRTLEQHYMLPAPAAANSAADSPQTFDLGDVDELEMEEVEEDVVEDAPDLWAMAPAQDGPPRAVSTMIPRLSPEGGVSTPGELPSRRTSARPAVAQAEASRFDPVPQPDAMPQRVSRLADALRAGKGGALALAAPLGAGPDYVPDRLGARLRARGLFQVLELKLSEDDAVAPLRLAGELVRFALALPPAARFWGWGRAESWMGSATHSAALLASRGLSPDQQAVALWLCGLGVAPRMSPAALETLAGELVERLASALMADNPLCLLIDGVDHLDASSSRLLASLVELSTRAPLLLVLSNANGAPPRCLPEGASELVSAEGREVPLDEEAILRALSPLGRKLVVWLALGGSPLPLSLLRGLAHPSVTPEELDVEVEWLRARGAVRCVHPEHLALPHGELASILLDELAVGVIPGEEPAISRLLELTHGAAQRWESPWLAARVRWLAWAGRRAEAFELTRRWGSELALGGWFEEAAAACGALERFWERTDLGALGERARLRALQARAWVAAGELGRASSALVGMESLAWRAHQEGAVWEVRSAAAWVLLLRGDASTAREVWRQAATRADALGEAEAWALSMMGLGAWELQRGDLLAAQQTLEAALSVWERRGWTWERGWTLATLAQVVSRRGQPAWAARYAQALTDAASLSPAAMWGVWASSAWAHVALASAQPKRALEEAERAAQGAQGLGRLALKSALLCAEAGVEAGAFEQAQGWARWAAQEAQRTGCAWSLARAQGYEELGAALSSHGDRALDALRRLKVELELAEGGGVGLELVERHAAMSRALRHLGKILEADDHRHQAHQWALRCHAEGLGARA